ncbi:MAG TPA: hypothetical protein VLE51_03515 [Candidatus Saccharimonadales bacterium]|nr:hypothetical protein [Candidatus Saccharimonadales bacterium]
MIRKLEPDQIISAFGRLWCVVSFSSAVGRQVSLAPVTTIPHRGEYFEDGVSEWYDTSIVEEHARFVEVYPHDKVV